MTEKKYHLIKDATTQEEIVREYTPEEYALEEAASAAALEQQVAAEAAEEALAALKASAKAKLIAGEPLTAEEAETIVL